MERASEDPAGFDALMIYTWQAPASDTARDSLRRHDKLGGCTPMYRDMTGTYASGSSANRSINAQAATPPRLD